jgi:hypothetical protein
MAKSGEIPFYRNGAPEFAQTIDLFSVNIILEGKDHGSRLRSSSGYALGFL